MRKFVAVLLVVCLSFTLAGCDINPMAFLGRFDSSYEKPLKDKQNKQKEGKDNGEKKKDKKSNKPNKANK